jgi:hypothetical protein
VVSGLVAVATKRALSMATVIVARDIDGSNAGKSASEP